MPSAELKLPIAPGLPWASVPLLEHQPPWPYPRVLLLFQHRRNLPFSGFWGRALLETGDELALPPPSVLSLASRRDAVKDGRGRAHPADAGQPHEPACRQRGQQGTPR